MFKWKVCILGVFVIFTLLLLLAIFPGSAAWLVIEGKPREADIAIVMGGGGGSRLRKALSLYEDRLVSELILVDYKASYWSYMLEQQCPDSACTDKKITILSGSTTTMTDAELSLKFSRAQGVNKVLVVTDPYHTRRTALTFSRVFRESNIEMHIVSSGDYGHLLSPDDSWWRDSKTFNTVWMELGKCIVVLFPW